MRRVLLEVVTHLSIKEALIIRTSHHTIAAPDAFVSIDIDNPVWVLEGSARRTDLQARGLGAVHALKGNGYAPHLGILAGLMFNDPQPQHPRGSGIFSLTNH